MAFLPPDVDYLDPPVWRVPWLYYDELRLGLRICRDSFLGYGVWDIGRRFSVSLGLQASQNRSHLQILGHHIDIIHILGAIGHACCLCFRALVYDA